MSYSHVPEPLSEPHAARLIYLLASYGFYSFLYIPDSSTIRKEKVAHRIDLLMCIMFAVHCSLPDISEDALLGLPDAGMRDHGK